MQTSPKKARVGVSSKRPSHCLVDSHISLQKQRLFPVNYVGDRAKLPLGQVIRCGQNALKVKLIKVIKRRTD
jgi:hypothetical protein